MDTVGLLRQIGDIKLQLFIAITYTNRLLVASSNKPEFSVQTSAVQVNQKEEEKTADFRFVQHFEVP